MLFIVTNILNTNKILKFAKVVMQLVIHTKQIVKQDVHKNFKSFFQLKQIA
jgi:BMFP domain-containing protein YqiC